MVYVFYLLLAVFQVQASNNLKNLGGGSYCKFLRLNVRKATVILHSQSTLTYTRCGGEL